MTEFILRRLRQDDYEVTLGSEPIGRMYEIEGDGRYVWTIYINAKVQRADGVAIKGYAETLDAAKCEFRASFETLIAAGTVKL